VSLAHTGIRILAPNGDFSSLSYEYPGWPYSEEDTHPWPPDWRPDVGTVTLFGGGDLDMAAREAFREVPHRGETMIRVEVQVGDFAAWAPVTPEVVKDAAIDMLAFAQSRAREHLKAEREKT
jgi:hypothetical protein